MSSTVLVPAKVLDAIISPVAVLVIPCQRMQGQHDVPFEEGASTVSGTLYLSGEEHCRLLNDVYTRFSHTNPMHADVFPSIRQMELEVLAMTASMVGGVPCYPSAMG